MRVQPRRDGEAPVDRHAQHRQWYHAEQEQPERPEPDAQHDDRGEDPPAVAERPQLARGAGDPRVIGHRDLDDPQPARDRLAGQLGLDLEARRAERDLLAEASAEGAVAREQVRVPRPDQEPEGRADQPVADAADRGSSPRRRASAAGRRRSSRPCPSRTGATSSGAASAG